MLNKYFEPNKKIRRIETFLLVILFIGTILTFVKGNHFVNTKINEVVYEGEVELLRDFSLEDYDEDNSICAVTYKNDSKSLVLNYSYEDYSELEVNSIKAYVYLINGKTSLCFDHPTPSEEEINNLYKTALVDGSMNDFTLASALAILTISMMIVLAFGKCFSTYEKCWFMTIMILATIISIIFPEESANGVNGVVIILLYLLDTFLNILCELLISKQSRYNFLVSVAVEIVEIATCIVLMYRFATLVTTLFFWLPIDIVSFINWTKHKDENSEELTEVRKLKGYQEVLIIIGIVIWTIVVGYFISGLNIHTDLFNHDLATIIAYLDACASALGIANGLFIFFRLEEQWVAWYLSALLETIINILTGQYVLLPLKIGYLTNTTYGYIKWHRYIKTHQIKNSIF